FCGKIKKALHLFAMKKVFYHLLSIPFYLLALLPFPAFYLFSDLICLLGYHVIGYRRKIIDQNLRNAFPEKSEQEIILIAKTYYHFMIDLFLESFKLLVMSKQEIEKRVIFPDLSIVKK